MKLFYIHFTRNWAIFWAFKNIHENLFDMAYFDFNFDEFSLPRPVLECFQILQSSKLPLVISNNIWPFKHEKCIWAFFWSTLYIEHCYGRVISPKKSKSLEPLGMSLKSKCVFRDNEFYKPQQCSNKLFLHLAKTIFSFLKDFSTGNRLFRQSKWCQLSRNQIAAGLSCYAHFQVE